jgi:glycine oxidase
MRVPRTTSLRRLGAERIADVPVANERFWAVELDRAEKGILESGQGAFDLSPDVLVVGGGIVGVATALACERAQLGSVQLIEAASLGAGATGGSAGLLHPEPHQGVDPPALVDLGRLSLARWRELETVVPGGVGFVNQDWIGLAPHPDPFVNDPPPTIRWLGRDEVARRLPDLALGSTGALISDQGRVNPQRALGRLAQELSHIATGVAATEVSTIERRIVAVATTAGTIRPGVVVFATGSPPRLDGVRLSVPSDLIKGHLLVTEPTDVRLSATVAPVATPIESQRLLVGGTLDFDDHTPDVAAQVIAALYDQLTVALPATTGVAVSHSWCCWRPHHPDGLPVIDRLPGVDNAWVSSGHFRTGLLMAPATADILVDWITTGARPTLAAPFALSRFCSTAPEGA